MTLASPHAPAAVEAPRKGWLVSPWFDLLFLANVAWPLIVFLGWWGEQEGHEEIRFWQIYFVTTPHRWITLALVFLDRDQFQRRGGTFLAIAIFVAAVCTSVWVATGTLTCLLTIDYVWNAWHFAAQHHGVWRIYGREFGPQQTLGLLWQKFAFRTFLLYVILRVAGGTWWYPSLDDWLDRLDLIVLLIPLSVLVAQGWSHVIAKLSLAETKGTWTYLLSVFGLYTSLLAAVHFHQPPWVLILATASALFHATEYLAIVTWSVNRKRKRASDDASQRNGLLAYMVPRWTLLLSLYLVAFGLASWTATQNWLAVWTFLNVIAAYLHYAYDGMIWKSNRPASYAS